MQVIEVISFKDQEEFIHFPKKLYSSDSNYVSPLDTDIRDVFDPKINKNFLIGNACRWLLVRDGSTIGRIAAFYKMEDNSLNGGIGFFECINNFEAAKELFDTAQNWLKKNACKEMKGPINFGEKDKYWGLLVNGFKNPSYQENYNFPYYQNLFEQYGFEKVFEQTTSEIGLSDFKSERFIKLSERVFRNPAYRFEHFKLNRLNEFASDFIHIYNKAWAHRPDFTPITQDKIESTLVSLKPIMIEEAIWFVYANNEPAGFYVNVLDVNQIFKHLNGTMNLWNKLKFLYHRHFGKINRVRGIVFGVIPQYQNLGLETGMIIKFYQTIRQTHPQYTCAELSWIGDFNPKMHSLFEALGAKTTKIHYTYSYTFTEK
ncbi:MAG: N-acetyltransferase [Bacteroidetes bacterium B1(2017)]|nr:MAG: N-acetyltransferase [Bacteroidetes bacterium B1(2017)]